MVAPPMKMSESNEMRAIVDIFSIAGDELTSRRGRGAFARIYHSSIIIDILIYYDNF